MNSQDDNVYIKCFSFLETKDFNNFPLKIRHHQCVPVKPFDFIKSALSKGNLICRKILDPLCSRLGCYSLLLSSNTKCSLLIEMCCCKWQNKYLLDLGLTVPLFMSLHCSAINSRSYSWLVQVRTQRTLGSTVLVWSYRARKNYSILSVSRDCNREFLWDTTHNL